MPIDLYPSVAKVKRNGVYQNLPGFVQQSGDADIEAMIANKETSTTAQFAHAKDSFFILNDVLYQADANIPVNGTIAVGTNCHVSVLGNDVFELIGNFDSQSEKIDHLNNVFESFSYDGIVPLEFTLTAGKGIANGTGEERSVQNSATDYIKIDKYNQIIYSRRCSTSQADIVSATLGMAFYNSEKVYISGQPQINKQSSNGYIATLIDVPTNAVYARFTAFPDETVSESLFFINGLSNLKENLQEFSISSNLWKYGLINNNYAIDAGTGEIYQQTGYDVTQFIPVTPGDIICGFGRRFYCYDSNKTAISGATGVLNSLTPQLENGMHFYVIPDNTNYFVISKQSAESSPVYVIKNAYSAYIKYIAGKEHEIKLYCLGDSITRGMYAEEGDQSSNGPTPQGYPYWIGQINGYTIVNLGNSGSGWANLGTPETPDDPSSANNAKTIIDNNSFSDADIITLAFGINDWKGAAQNITLGDMTSQSGDGTAIGNMKYCIEKLSEKIPTAQIIILLPMNGNRVFSGMDSDAITLANNWYFGYQYRNSQTLNDYRSAIKTCADYYNVKVIDLEEVCPINRMNIRDVCGDGVHPTKAFYKQMGQALAPLIH